MREEGGRGRRRGGGGHKGLGGCHFKGHEKWTFSDIFAFCLFGCVMKKGNKVIKKYGEGHYLQKISTLNSSDPLTLTGPKMLL